MTHQLKFMITKQLYSTKVGVNWFVKIIDVEDYWWSQNWNPWILTLLVISWLRHAAQYTDKCDAIIYRVLICNTISITYYSFLTTKRFPKQKNEVQPSHCHLSLEVKFICIVATNPLLILWFFFIALNSSSFILSSPSKIYASSYFPSSLVLCN